MNNATDRIKLAEAMGWEQHAHGWWSSPRGKSGICHHGIDTDKLPDPYTDANDDYAVLEWMRFNGLNEDSCLEMDEPYAALPDKGSYQIGDYARAALKVIT